MSPLKTTELSEDTRLMTKNLENFFHRTETRVLPGETFSWFIAFCEARTPLSFSRQLTMSFLFGSNDQLMLIDFHYILPLERKSQQQLVPQLSSLVQGKQASLAPIRPFSRYG